jgi:uncharacterized protein involved in exopolysaccharide biosynthesis
MIERQKQDEYPNDSHDDEIDLSEIWAVLVKFKKLILLSMLSVSILTAGLSLLMPNVYRAEVLLASTADSKTGIASALGGLGGLGGLASMAGLSLGEGGSSDESLAVLQSREFLWQFAQKNNLLPVLFESRWDADKKRWKSNDPKDQPNQWDVYRFFTKGGFDVSKNKKTELITVGVEWKDSALAAIIANSLVEQLNEYQAKKAIERSGRNLKYLNQELERTQIEEMRKLLFDMIASEQKSMMVARTQKEYAFKVIDPAVAPDKKIKPFRSLIVIVMTMLAGLIASVYGYKKAVYLNNGK